ncbi:MAG: right-handed parallel beta-helix repeat-containing protein [candidate division KSB1 bacterium]|nr:right-handed parallel beta-helix repeat-containing protein [candidate division KSB1 bacterium]MDZ7301659.1 right-handed parallel beta-helix repeat-containing protein [candidate division KSB1 bacterium]MDZ7313480.1 right-handed parallel beta-helix repeat-containing protein [candidate division KSB1 bacterium]
MFRIQQNRGELYRALQIALAFLLLAEYGQDPVSAYAGNYYVATTGSDANPGTEAAPFLTIQKAVTVATPGDVVLIKAGTYGPVRIYVGGGIGKSGTATAPIIYKAYGDGDVIIKGTGGTALWIEGEYIEFHDLKITNPAGHAIFMTGKGPAGSGKIATNHIKFLRCEIFRAYKIGVLADYDTYENEFLYCEVHHNGTIWFEDQGFYIGGDRYKFIGNSIHDNASTGIQLWSSYSVPGHPSGNIIKDNLIYANGYTVVTNDSNFPSRRQYGHGIVLGSSYGGTDNNLITNNLIFANFPNGITSYSNLGENNMIYNNTIVCNVVGINLDGIAAKLLIKNNIVHDNSSTAVGQWLQKNRPELLNSINPARHGAGANLSASGNGTNFDRYELDYNLWGPTTHFIWKGIRYSTFQQYQTASGQDANSILAADPGFVDPATNYRLKPTSPAIDAGTTLLEVTNDLEGNSRPQGLRYDLGAYEAGGKLSASIDASPTSGPIPLTVNFNGSAYGGTPPYFYSWNFGNNNSSNQQNPQYTFTAIDSHVVKLTVTDAQSNKTTTSTTIVATDSAVTPSVVDIKFTHVNQTTALDTITTETWYDLYLLLNDPQGWNDLSYADVWYNHTSDKQGTTANRGGHYLAASNYIASYSLEDSTIWAKENEGTEIWTDLTGRLGVYVDDDANEYKQNGTHKWAKARVKLLDSAISGTWHINAVVWDREKHRSALVTKNVMVAFKTTGLAALLEATAPFPENDGKYHITLTTSKPVAKVPAPLSFIASDGTITTIKLTGTVPGNTFTGELLKSSNVAEGNGYFILGASALVDQAGNTSNEIVQGKNLKIDWPPSRPQNVIIKP